MIDEYIKSELEDAIVDPDSNLTYRKRKIDREQASSSHETVASTSVNANIIEKETSQSVKFWKVEAWAKVPFYSISILSSFP